MKERPEPLALPITNTGEFLFDGHEHNFAKCDSVESAEDVVSLMKDAARYRLLRDTSPGFNSGDFLKAEDLDEACDSAIAQAEGESK